MLASENPYLEIQITTSTPEKLLVLLLEGALNFTRIARELLLQGDLAGKGMNIGRAHAIVAELMNTLNHEIAPVMARDLERLYTYVIDEYIAANISNDPKHLDNAIQIIATMRDTWAEAIEIARKERIAGKGA